MRISMIGCKGIPAAFSQGGGIETHVEELATRLAKAGHKVTVYVRPYANPDGLKSYKGVKLITLPTVRRKNLDAIVATFLASVHVLFEKADIVHYHAVGPSTLAWIPRLFKPGCKVVATFHGQDRFHEKWRWPARLYLKFGEWAVKTFPHATIAVSHSLQLLCKRKKPCHVWYIPNGVEPIRRTAGTDELRRFGLEPGRYFYLLSRFIPVKAIEDAIRAFREVRTDMRMAVIGYAGPNRTEQAYESRLRELASSDPRIVFTGKQTGEVLHQLVGHAYAMVHPSRSEGLSFSVLEAMANGRLVIMSDIEPNLELIDHSGIAYQVGNVSALRDAMVWALADPGMVKERGSRAAEVVKHLYSWDSVVSRTEALYFSLLKHKSL